MTPHLVLLALLQAVDPGVPRDFLLYVADAAAVGAFAFAWRTSARLARIETILTESEIGVIPRLTGTSRQAHNHANVLQAHEGKLDAHDARLDGHDRDIERLERDKDPKRALGPTDVGTLDRRGS
jgi:IS5 family transposase